MPATAAIRKGPAVADPSRRQSARQARTTSSRPANYYARPFGSMGGPVEEPTSSNTPGFYPAITYFTDSITALPKEVMRHFSMLKEVEAKVHGPDEVLAELSDKLWKLPPPPRQRPSPPSQMNACGGPSNTLNFTANNSAAGSAPGSLLNGASDVPQQAADVLANTAQAQSADEDANLERRKEFFKLGAVLHSMIATLDEKNAVISTANQTLTKQLARMDSSYPHIEKEVSEEARLGSSTHWAYGDKESKKANGTTANERARRDVAATNSLAAAAATVHEGDIAAARSEARREAMLAKRGRNQHADSDFDDKPAAPSKKSHAARARKPAETASEVMGLGIINGGSSLQPNKRRKIEKGVAPAMERSLSGAFGRGRGMASPRETPAVETVKKRAKAGPAPTLPKKRVPANASPALASSPLHGSFAATKPSPAPRERPQSSRARQNSSTSILQRSIAGLDNSKAAERPSSATSNRPSTNDATVSTPELKTVASMTGRTVPEARSALKESYTTESGDLVVEDDNVRGALVLTGAGEQQDVKHEDAEENTEMQDIQTSPTPPAASGAASTSATAAAAARTSGKASNAGTPRTDSFPADAQVPMSRSRSTRRNNNVESHHSSGTASNESLSNAQPSAAKRSHKKGSGGGSVGLPKGLPKELQPFNKSPVNTRALVHSPTPPSPRDLDGNDDEAMSGPGSVLSELDINTSLDPPPNLNNDGSMGGNDDGEADARVEAEGLGQVEGEAEVEGDDEDDDEPKYCYCNSVSYGEMVACDNDNCEREWFHLACVGLTRPPGSKTKWFCDDCKELLKLSKRPGSRHYIPV